MRSSFIFYLDKSIYVILSQFILLIESFTGCDWSGDTHESTWECCSTSEPCALFEGDCELDDECIGHLLCGSNNCLGFFPSTADCCYDPATSKIINTSHLEIKKKK